MMTINICGIEHKIIECEDNFDVDIHFGMIDYKKAEIRVNKDASEAIKIATICHEVLHGMLVHIGRDDLSNDEQFVTALGNTINQSFVLRVSSRDDITKTYREHKKEEGEVTE